MAAEAHGFLSNASLRDLEAECRLSLAAEALTLGGLTALESSNSADLAAARCQELEVIN